MKKIRLICMFKFKNKYSMSSFFCFYCWLWPLPVYQFSFSTLNFEEVFVSRVWKTSHNVLETLFQDLFHSAIYHCTQLKQVTTILSAYYDMNILWAYVSALNLLLESQTSNHRFISLFDLLYHRYFPEFWLCQNENLFKSWKQWKKLVGV